MAVLFNMEKKDNIYFKDAYRAQYYLNVLGRVRDILIYQLTSFEIKIPVINKNRIADSIIVEIGDSLDQIILPTIANEIYNSKKSGLLKGKTSYDKYRSFFIMNGSWTKEAKSVKIKVID